MAVPVSLDDAKRQLRHAGETLNAERQAEIEGFIADAVAWVEDYTGHILVARDVAEQFGGLGRVHLRAWPIRADAIPSITYGDAIDAVVDVAAVWIDVSRRPARVALWIGHRWPSMARGIAITVTLRAGYEEGDVVPGNIRRAMLILIAAYDADREGGDVFASAEQAARRLCRDLKMRRV